jgi:hypothetical protein
MQEVNIEKQFHHSDSIYQDREIEILNSFE